ncbi:CAP domain-containing protein [Aerococcus urinae]|uniref:CAP domain-containing protein n=1 Tax=Aerococcus urinae TaxID=1376 RepID=UPI00227BD811|nr:CAP domain-containing protein [Aerococcus urinae]MCY3047026.1 CAP domain-containing protein [Aerococcus urinae]
MELNKKLLLGLSAVGLGVFGLSDQVKADEYDDFDDYDDIYEGYDYDDYDDYDNDDFDYDDYDDDDDWDDDDEVYYTLPAQHSSPIPTPAPAAYSHYQGEVDDDHADDYNEVNQQNLQVQAINGTTALEASLVHSGVAEAEIRDLEIEVDEEDGRLVYEVEFEHGANEYEYLIDGLNAAVLDYEYDYDDDLDDYDDDQDDDNDGLDDDQDDDINEGHDKKPQGQGQPSQPKENQRLENPQGDSKADHDQEPSNQSQTDQPSAENTGEKQPIADQTSTSQPVLDQGVSMEEAVVAHFHDLVNAERQSLGLSSLSYGNAYQAASDIRTKEIIDVFSHTRPNGQAFNTASGFEGAGNYVGENIQQSYTQAGTSPQAIAQDLFDNWKASPGHYENMIDPGFNSQAVGLEFVQDGDYILVYSAQILGQ